MTPYILTFLAGVAVPIAFMLYWPEDKELRYLQGVLSAIRDSEHCTSELAFDYYEETSWRCSGYGRDAFDKGYQDTLDDMRLQWRKNNARCKKQRGRL